jgi:hypothetical protein
MFERRPHAHGRGKPYAPLHRQAPAAGALVTASGCCLGMPVVSRLTGHGGTSLPTRKPTVEAS